MIDNYPPGAANDPRAPYNQPEPRMIDCDRCEGFGYTVDDEGESFLCPRCDATGRVEDRED